MRSCFRHILFFCVVLLVSGSCYGDLPEREDAYRAYLNKKISIQGLGWEGEAKGLGFRVITPSGAVIYLRKHFKAGDRMGFRKWHGGLIEVSGVISIKSTEVVAKGDQGYNKSFNYLAMDVHSIRSIDKVVAEYTLPDMQK